MGLELDTLKRNDMVYIVYNNTTGGVVEFYDLKSLKEAIFDAFRVNDHQFGKYFTKEEITNFFIDNDIELDEEELDKLLKECEYQ